MSLVNESKITLRLAAPLIIGQLSQMMLGVADTVMVGQLGVTPLATLTFANSLFYVPFVFGIGVLTSISVHSAHARGASDAQAARSSCRHGLYISLVMGVVFLGLSLLLLPLLGMLGQPVAVVDLTKSYFLILMVSIIPGLASIALKNHADALNRPWPPFWLFLGGVLLNIVLNWVMIYGHLGCPALGMNGAAWATLISRIAMLVGMVVWLTRAPGLRDWVPFRWWRWPVRQHLVAHAKIGAPASFQMLCEVGAFSAAGLMMGYFGQVSMAAHQVAITCASAAFMIPLGLAMALTVRTGAVSGSGDLGRLRAVVVSGWLLAVGFGLFNALLFFLGGPFLAGFFTADPAVIALAAAMLLIVGIFQLFDCLQVASSSMLRGLHVTRLPALMVFIAYWLVGLPVAGLLGWYGGMEARGIWWGLAAGLFVASISLAWPLWARLRAAEKGSLLSA